MRKVFSFKFSGRSIHLMTRVQSARSTVIDEAITQSMCCKTDPFGPTIIEESSTGSEE